MINNVGLNDLKLFLVCAFCIFSSFCYILYFNKLTMTVFYSSNYPIYYNINNSIIYFDSYNIFYLVELEYRVKVEFCVMWAIK